MAPYPLAAKGLLYAGQVGGQLVVLELVGSKVVGAIFDPHENRWTEVARANAPRLVGQSHGVPDRPIGDFLPLRGGWSYSPAYLDVRANRWIDGSRNSPPPGGREPVEVATSQGIVAMTDDGSVDFASLWLLSPERRAWQRISAKGAPGKRFGAAIVGIDDGMLVWGGAELTHVVGGKPRFRAFDGGARFRLADQTWHPITAAPGASRAHPFAAVHGREVVVLGGKAAGESGAPIGGAAFIDLETNHLSVAPAEGGPTVEDLDRAPHGDVFALSGSHALFLTWGRPSQSLRAFAMDLDARTWTETPPVPRPAELRGSGDTPRLVPINDRAVAMVHSWSVGGAQHTRLAAFDFGTRAWCEHSIPDRGEPRALFASGNQLVIWGFSQVSDDCPPCREGEPCIVCRPEKSRSEFSATGWLLAW